MKRVIALALALAACASPPGRHGGGGIVSVNPCADAMLVGLVPASRIAAISHYSHDPVATSLPIAVARRFRATAGTAEEVIALAPDLVVASSFTAPATRDAFARAGLRTLYLDAPATIAASEAQVRTLATAVDARTAGERMVAAIERSLPPMPPPAPMGRRPAALLFIAGDLATGAGTLLDEMMTRAGFANAAAGYGLRFTGRLPAERLVAEPPEVVIAPAGGRGVDLRRRLLPRTVAADFPRRLVNCGGPTIAPAMRRLMAIRAALA